VIPGLKWHRPPPSRAGASRCRAISGSTLAPHQIQGLVLDTTPSAHDLQSEMSTVYGSLRMPWTPNDAERHTHKATTGVLKELWAKVANESLARTGDEGRAVREANAVVARAEPSHES